MTVVDRLPKKGETSDIGHRGVNDQSGKIRIGKGKRERNDKRPRMMS